MSTSYSESIYARLTRAEDEAKQIRLTHMRWLATGVLVVVIILYAVSVKLADTGVVWPYVRAFAEAATVGALADWFAVSALFRHPLGLTFIPHTAIIPKNKDRIADNLGDFVQGEFFSEDRVREAIVDADPASRLAEWAKKEDNAQALARGIAKMMAYALGKLDSKTVHDHLRQMIASRFVEMDLSSLAARVLHSLTKDDRHQGVLDEMLAAANGYLNDPLIKARLKIFLAEHIPLWFDKLKEASANVVVDKLVDFGGKAIAEIATQPDHLLRGDFDKALRNLIDKLSSDRAFRARISEHQRELANNNVLTEYVETIWNDLSDWLKSDLTSRRSVLCDKFATAAQAFGASLLKDSALRTSINNAILDQVPALVEHARPKIAGFISAKMKEWKDHEVVRKLELNIGRDLQFIRLNGTFVGGLIGLAIHVVTIAL
jgi:uncharacterized membrane-anchored protein YjiN (DUF445 family)